MKHLICTLSILVATSLQTVANADPEHHGVQPFATDHRPVFPQYSHTRQSFRNDPLRNRVSNDHLQRIEFAHLREENTMRRSQAVNTHVNINMSTYGRTLHPVYDQRRVIYQDRFNHFHNWEIAHPTVWRTWQAHHFYGGAYYGFHPISNISIYYYNPLVHWFYIGSWDPAYYRAWYANEYEAYPNANHAFPYYGVYYPTDNLKQLLFGVSAMPMAEQSHFRSGMITFTEQLTQNLANLTHQHVVLASGDITVTHYETLGLDRGIELEGAVNFQGRAYDFKGLIRLGLDRSVETFVADENGDQTSSEQLVKLDHLNQSISELQSSPILTRSTTNPVAQAIAADPNVKSEYQAPATAGSKPWYPAGAAAPAPSAAVAVPTEPSVSKPDTSVSIGTSTPPSASLSVAAPLPSSGSLPSAASLPSTTSLPPATSSPAVTFSPASPSRADVNLLSAASVLGTSPSGQAVANPQ